MAENDLRGVAFPKLDATQLASLERCPLTVIKRYRDGEKLFRGRPARLELLRCQIRRGRDRRRIGGNAEDGHGPWAREFTGEVGQLTGGPSLVTAVARGDCEAYEVSPDAFRQLLDHNPQLGDIILQAFIARRQLLRESEEFTGLRVIGSGYSQNTFRIRDFLAKNRIPFTGWIWKPIHR
jgi:thioredoxin reductase (NADPH)